MSDLIERASLTDEEVYWSFETGGRDVADAAMAKALWAMVDWLGTFDDCEPSTPEDECMVGRLRALLTEAGIPKPQEARA